MYIPNLADYYECTPLDIAKRRGIYTSEVQDAIIEATNQYQDIYTFAMTDNAEAIDNGTDVIFATKEGNFIWYPDGDFELIENRDQQEEDGYPVGSVAKSRGKTTWDFLRQGDRYSAMRYAKNQDIQKNGRRL